ncbi:alcohol dehydrogenase catalytic domain-containing protein [Funiculus sociatus GB2-A5]|uniref:Alcohol dehydrogenase catalytic domain-containing protein n=1 Tax=Funiculus sociatus GB2-A5 TaxID=2933946 RepID=A0ABV0JM33_9CYAN|nr:MULTISPECIES: alcohol dehydrogenase catalytic domain-containing protein [unclassified Trichocoleus]MBD1904860.1 alcohol dehydrogenase catalytic domain-containing protein [Trichocoleus sp. FACHB-832]MBD2064619.1 alcohol dehydrogenase catalytic domain-containing protein [Trichocoleus sp. FACHB-6]
MRLEDISLPEPKSEEVLIKIHACRVNADTLVPKNQYIFTPSLPFIPGFEVPGTIEKLGTEVTGFSIGQRVVAFISNGGYAEYATAQQN